MDIRNAFNTADWSNTLAALRRFNVPNSIMNVVSSYFGFADDVALVVVAKHKEEAVRAANKAIESMEQSFQNAGLSLAPQKTEAVLVSSRKVLETATIQVGGMAIT
ncbi:hypothetical protein KR026_002587, partial [Drosophila bipectinata]